MASVPHEFVTVDMRGLKSALIERSRQARVSVSSLVRTFVEKGLGGETARPPVLRPMGRHGTVKLSLRISAEESDRLTTESARASISRAAYLAELIVAAPQSATRDERASRLAALAASNAELSTLSRNVRHLVDLIRQGSKQAAADYARLLDTIGDDVRKHLSRSSALMVDLQQTRRARAARRADPNRARTDPHG